MQFTKNQHFEEQQFIVACQRLKYEINENLLNLTLKLYLKWKTQIENSLLEFHSQTICARMFYG